MKPITPNIQDQYAYIQRQTTLTKVKILCSRYGVALKYDLLEGTMEFDINIESHQAREFATKLDEILSGQLDNKINPLPIMKETPDEN